MVTNILLGAVLLLLAFLVVLIVRAIRSVASAYNAALTEYESAKSELLRLFVPAEGEKASPLANFVEAASSAVGRAVVAQAKTTLMGMQSGAVRGEAAVAGDIAEDIAGQTPAGALLQAFPKLSKSLRRNPGLIDLALPFLAQLGNRGNGQAQPTSGNGNGHSPRFTFGR